MTTSSIPAIGQPWPEQGGILVGSRLIDGEPYHIIIPGGIEHDIEASHNNAVERIAAKGEINGFSDWRHGDQRDLMLAYINVPAYFQKDGMESIQISSTPYGSNDAWAVDFENGDVHIYFCCREFRVRPFRSVNQKHFHGQEVFNKEKQ